MLVFSESDYSSSFDLEELESLTNIINATDAERNIAYEWGDAIKVSLR